MFDRGASMSFHAPMLVRRLAACLVIVLASTACGGGGGSDESSASDASSGASDPTGQATALDCKSYCDTITANCTSGNAQYASVQQCQSTCDAFTLGDEADRDGNTLGCRVYHADAAKGEPAMHCTHAGPGGAGQCGSNCEGFCTIAGEACPGTFADDAACLSACADFSDSEPFDAGDKAGDSLACRLYHLTVATEDPDKHCAHIVSDSPTCGG